jgi:SAM-dependent methyltransferase
MSSSTPDPTAATILAYHEGAASYAKHSRDRDHLARLRDPLLARLPAQPLILDLGSGPGHDAALLAQAGATVVALDPAPALLREAQRYGALAGRLVNAEAGHLPFTDAVFDGIWSCAALLHIPHAHIARALEEAFRILRPGGTAFFSMSEGDPYDLVPDTSLGLAVRAYYYHRADDWAALVQAAGFELVDHDVNRTAGNFNIGSTGWIETYARGR